MACQRCGLTEAVPYQSHTTDGRNQIDITIRCNSCHHEWQETFELPSMFMPDVRLRAARRKHTAARS